MSHETFEIGRKVRIWFYTNQDGSSSLRGTLTHMPCDVGDLIYIKEADGELKAINPGCSSFELMTYDK